MNPDEKLLGQAHNARLVHLNEQVIFPWCAKRIDELVASLCIDFKDGKMDSMKVASLAAFRDLQYELNSLARRGDVAFAKLGKLEQ